MAHFYVQFLVPLKISLLLENVAHFLVHAEFVGFEAFWEKLIHHKPLILLHAVEAFPRPRQPLLLAVEQFFERGAAGAGLVRLLHAEGIGVGLH